MSQYRNRFIVGLYPENPARNSDYTAVLSPEAAGGKSLSLEVNNLSSGFSIVSELNELSCSEPGFYAVFDTESFNSTNI